MEQFFFVKWNGSQLHRGNEEIQKNLAIYQYLNTCKYIENINNKITRIDKKMMEIL